MRNNHSPRRSIFSMLRRAGRAETLGRVPSHRHLEAIEPLENRVLLAGDEPNFAQVFNTPTPLTPPEIVIDGAGVGTSVTGAGSSVISPSGDDDVFRFTAPTNDFVRIWGDALSTLSPLDSRVEVYTGTIGGAATLIASGSTQGTLTTGTLKDGWVGFKAIQGQEYFVVVKSDQLTGAPATGDYTLRIAAKSLPFPSPNVASGQASFGGTITRPGSDVVYKLVLPANTTFNGIMTVQAEADPTDLDPHLDVYDSNGALIRSDSDSGNLTDSYLSMVSQANAVYYIRIRSDEFGDPNLRPSTGAFTVVVDGISEVIGIDPVTRLSPAVSGGIADAKETHLYTFVAQGTGLSFITLGPDGATPIPDSFLHLYNDQAVEIGTNNLPGAASRMLIQLVGGTRYFLVVEAFSSQTGGGGYTVQVEAHHTFDQAPNQTPIAVDDHVNLPAGGDPNAAAVFEEATPIVWGPAQNAPVPVTGLQPPLPNPGTDHVKVLLGVAQGRIHDGTDTDLFQFVPPVDMLANYAGQVDPTTLPPPPTAMPLWEPNFRPSSRLQITGFGTDVFMPAPAFQVFDSNFNLVYTSSEVITNSGVFGGLDPASVPPQLPMAAYGYTFGGGQPANIKVWGGEVYYLAVAGGGAAGRYQFTLQVDAPTDTHSDFTPAVPTAGNFASAWEVQIDATTGEGRNFNDVANADLFTQDGINFVALTGNGTPPLQGRGYAMNITRPAPPPAGTGATVAGLAGTAGTRGELLLQMSELGTITSPTDTDLYQFRATYTGTAEVRLATTQLADSFWDAAVRSYDSGDQMLPAIVAPNLPVQTVFPVQNKTYNSPLDGALRIFDNDQTEITYDNDNSVTSGVSDVADVGAFGGVTFQRRDPRVVFPVQAGKTYYVQVESGQRSNFNLTFPKVDWRHATGSYELLINSMSNQNFNGDDHINSTTPGSIQQATPIPTDLNVTSPTAVIGSVIGEIKTVPIANPDDTDTFTFISPADGIAVFKLSLRSANPPSNPISFARTLTIFDANGGFIGTQASANATDPNADLTVSVAAVQGDRFFVVVDGDEGAGGLNQGLYTVSVSGVPFKDDYASEDSYVNAFTIDKNLYDYDGTETVNGSIESTGDTDVFTFQSLAFDVVTVQVVGSAGFSPIVKIYEISVDPAGNPVRLLIADNTPAIGGLTAQISFSVSAPPRTTGSGSYPNYFIVVGGQNPDTSKGNYALTLSVNVTTDDHPDGPNPPPPGTATVPGQFPLATIITPGPTGNGGSSGVIELQGDTDLFTFTVPAQGLVTVNLVSPTSSHLLPRIRLIDATFGAVTDIATTQVFVTGTDLANSVATFTFTAPRDGVFYIMVEGVDGTGNTFKTDDVGAYFITLNVPVPDDHPNTGEFNIADNIPLSPFSGDGSASGLISPRLDTDLFKFTAILSGNMVVTISTPGSQMNPGLRLYLPDQSEVGTLVVDGGPGDDDGAVNGSITRHFAIIQGSTYFLLVSSDQAASQTTGTYSVSLNGPSPVIAPDDHANAGDFVNADEIVLDQTTGDGTGTGNIEVPGDTDLFFFTSLAGSSGRPLQAFVQVVTPNGQLLDVGVRIIRQDQTTTIATDTGGGPGFNAGVNFGIVAAGERYYIEVDGLGNLAGSYTVRIDTSPESYFLYYPDGFAKDGTREYVSVGNANDYDVDYTVTLRYEDPSIPEVVISGLAPANKRSGVTIADGSPVAPNLNNKHYAIIIESNGFLGANISHYDTDATLGEAFSRQPSPFWSFAKGEKFPGGIDDELVTYNPNATASRVTLTTYQLDGTAATVVQTVPGFSRLTWAFNSLPGVPVGQFAFTVTSEPANGTDSQIGIVASLSHFDISNSDGYAVMGDNHGGATTGVLPGLIDSGNLAPSQFSEVTIFNTSNTTATITLLGRYQSTNIPDFIRPITLNPHESLTLTGAQLGLVANQTVGIRYTSSTAITVLESTRRFGDADATQGQSEAGTKWYFGDAFMNRLRAGQLYFENMYFYNPASIDISIQLRFIFNTGADTSYTFNVPAQNFAAVALHQLAAILGHGVLNYYSIEATSDAPFIVSMTHYDLVLGGGWGSQGAPLGLTNSISSIT